MRRPETALLAPRRRATMAMLAVAAATVIPTTATAEFPVEDIPTRRPSLVWEHEVDCGEFGCAAAVGSEAVYVVRRSRSDAGAELVAVDAVTGESRWRRPIAGPAWSVAVSDDSVVVSGKSYTGLFAIADGAELVETDLELVGLNYFGVLFLDDGVTVTAMDAADGTQLWTRRDGVRVWRVCRDIVVLAGRHDERPFEVAEQFTGQRRWTSDDRFVADDGMARCFGPYLYVADGDSMREFEIGGGDQTWRTSIDGADRFEFFGDIAIAHGADDSVGLDLWDGAVLWRQPTEAIGELVDPYSWLRTDGRGLFKVLPWNGETIAVTDPFAEVDATAATGSMSVLDFSETRVALRRGATVVTLGLKDLGVSWTLELPVAPDWTQVHAGSLLVLTGDTLTGYRASPIA